MTDDSKPGQSRPDEADPLSATAMFLRALDQQSEAKPAEPAGAKVERGTAAERTQAPPVGSRPGNSGSEFTEIFGKPLQPTSEFSMRSAPTQQVPAAEPVRPAEPVGSQSPGEFTRIFVKDPTPPAKPAARSFEERQEGVPSQPARSKGFSSPGVSDAASGEPGFTQIFKPVPGGRGAGSPAQPGQPFVPSSRPEAARSDAQFGRPSDPPNAAKADLSITSLIESLSSPSAGASGPRAPEPAPYRPDPLASYQPSAAKPAPPSDFESGGVTRFIQRLADPPAAQPAPAPPPPIREANAGPGEYTRIISLASPAASAPPAPSPAPAGAQAPEPGISFARPAAPPLPQNPIHVAMPPAAAPAAPAPPAFAAPPVPAPRLPAAPAPPTAAAPKGKLEAMVPMLLVVNTFLLVIILVVMIFLIKSR